MTLVVRSSLMPVPATELFAFHMNPENLTAISPRFPPFRLQTAPKPAEEGDRQVMRIGSGRLGVTWVARITRIVPSSLMEDVQDEGPFLSWLHQHRVTVAPEGSRLTDVVSFRLLPTKVGEFLEYFLVRPAIIGMFEARHRKTRKFLSHHIS